MSHKKTKQLEVAQTVNLYKIIRNARFKHGVKTGDYKNYRQFCSRKLRNIRSRCGIKCLDLNNTPAIQIQNRQKNIEHKKNIKIRHRLKNRIEKSGKTFHVEQFWTEDEKKEAKLLKDWNRKLRKPQIKKESQFKFNVSEKLVMDKKSLKKNSNKRLDNDMIAEVDDVFDDNEPLIPSSDTILTLLFLCERAWSYSKQLYEEYDEDNKRKFHHSKSRLKKCIFWSKKLFFIFPSVLSYIYYHWLQASLYLQTENNAQAYSQLLLCSRMEHISISAGIEYKFKKDELSMNFLCMLDSEIANKMNFLEEGFTDEEYQHLQQQTNEYFTVDDGLVNDGMKQMFTDINMTAVLQKEKCLILELKQQSMMKMEAEEKKKQMEKAKEVVSQNTVEFMSVVHDGNYIQIQTKVINDYLEMVEKMNVKLQANATAVNSENNNKKAFIFLKSFYQMLIIYHSCEEQCLTSENEMLLKYLALEALKINVCRNYLLFIGSHEKKRQKIEDEIMKRSKNENNISIKLFHICKFHESQISDLDELNATFIDSQFLALKLNYLRMFYEMSRRYFIACMYFVNGEWNIAQQLFTREIMVQCQQFMDEIDSDMDRIQEYEQYSSNNSANNEQIWFLLHIIDIFSLQKQAQHVLQLSEKYSFLSQAQILLENGKNKDEMGIDFNKDLSQLMQNVQWIENCNTFYPLLPKPVLFDIAWNMVKYPEADDASSGGNENKAKSKKWFGIF